MGILNVTPDSFSDGGQFFDPDSACRHAEQMAADGADILDIGGESSRPGAEPLPEAEELRGTLPVIERIAGSLPVPLSVDTYKAVVARRAVQAGAAMVNDISAGAFDPAMLPAVAELGVPICLMHIKGTPKDMQKRAVY